MKFNPWLTIKIFYINVKHKKSLKNASKMYFLQFFNTFYWVATKPGILEKPLIWQYRLKKL